MALFRVVTFLFCGGRAVVRLQGRQSPMAREAEGEILRVFKREMREQRAIIIKALSEVSAFGEIDGHSDLPAVTPRPTRRNVFE